MLWKQIKYQLHITICPSASWDIWKPKEMLLGIFSSSACCYLIIQGLFLLLLLPLCCLQLSALSECFSLSIIYPRPDIAWVLLQSSLLPLSYTTKTSLVFSFLVSEDSKYLGLKWWLQLHLYSAYHSKHYDSLSCSVVFIFYRMSKLHFSSKKYRFLL